MTQSGRIEEHGLHIWFGFYHNAFRMMGQVYDELGRPPDHPLSTVERAFVGADQHLFLEHLDTGLKHWLIEFPHDDGFPGTSDSDLPDVHELLQRLVNFARDHFHQVLLPHASRSDAARFDIAHRTAGRQAGVGCPHRRRCGGGRGRGRRPGGGTFLAARVRGNSAVAQDLHRVLAAVASHLRDVMDATLSDDIRRAWIIIDLALTYARGFIADDVLLHGFKPLDRFEFREWLHSNGAQDQAVQSAVVQAFYDASFSYADGRVDQPNVAAGVAIRATLRIIFGYVGHVVFKMNAGMGDTIFAPIYEVLKRRGVTFKFFHRVTALEPGAVPGTSARGIARVHLARQVDLVGPEYQPLVQVNGLPCWPSTPLTDQIKNGDRLAGRQPRVALERLAGCGNRDARGWTRLRRPGPGDFARRPAVHLPVAAGRRRAQRAGVARALRPGEDRSDAGGPDLDARVGRGHGLGRPRRHHRVLRRAGRQLGGLLAGARSRRRGPPAPASPALFYGCGPMPDTNPPIPPPDDTRLSGADARVGEGNGRRLLATERGAGVAVRRAAQTASTQAWWPRATIG